MYRHPQTIVKLAPSQFVPNRPYAATVERVESLPFMVRLAETTQDLANAVEIRSSAYSRHIPKLGDALRVAEAEDYQSDVLLLIAERKLDDKVIGTMRLQPNFNGPLKLEGETELPVAFRGKRLLETTRLGVENGNTGRMVMVALVKAAFEICHACSVDYGFAVGRRSMLEVFRSLAYDIVDGPLRMPYASVPLWILSIPIRQVEARLRDREHAYFDFMARTEHPDIRIDYDRVFEALGAP